MWDTLLLSAFNLDLCPQMTCSAVKGIIQVHRYTLINSVDQIKMQERRRESAVKFLRRVTTSAGEDFPLDSVDWP